jgi:NAD(P)H dehydrogenase (quinone)
MPKIAVTGASGKLGGATIEFLLERDVAPGDIVAVVRDVAKAAALAERGIDVRRGDYSDAPSLEKAFRGVDRLAFISTSALGDERMLHHGNVVTAARAARVAHIFESSVIKPAAEAKIAASPGPFHTERLLRESGITHTFFRNNLYMDLVPLMFGSAVTTGRLAHNGADGRVGFIARSDVARAFAAVLASDGHGNRDYQVTAPQPYGLADVARGLSRASGKSVEYDPLSSTDFGLLLESVGVPPPLVSMSVALGEAIRAGEFDARSGDVEKLTGRTPVTLDAFLAQAFSS